MSYKTMSFEDYRGAVAGTSQYLDAADPELVIRNGMVEEVSEILTADNFDELAKEIGDGVYYVNAAARLGGLSLEAVTSVETFRDWQARVDIGDVATMPIFDTLNDRALVVDSGKDLAIRALRVVDTMSPATDALWTGFSRRPLLADSLHDVFASLAGYASECDVDLEAAVQATLQKVKQRRRQPRVIDQASMLAGSGRERLLNGPLAGLFGGAVTLAYEAEAC